MIRTILVSLASAIITFVVTVALAAIVDYAWVQGSGDSSLFDTLVWIFVFGWPFLATQLLIPAFVVGLVTGICYNIWPARHRRIRSWFAATLTFALTSMLALITSYAWIYGSAASPRFDALAWTFVGWPILLFPLFIPAIIAGIVAAYRNPLRTDGRRDGN